MKIISFMSDYYNALSQQATVILIALVVLI